MTVSTDDAPVDAEVRAIAAERLTFFADAVIAIAITLLALDLPEPKGSTNAEVLQWVAGHRAHYIAFLISFVVVGAHWSGHHRVFRYVTTLGGRLSAFTVYWLLMQVLTPFATKVLTGDGAFEVRFTFYALVQATAGVLFLCMLGQIRRHHLLRPDTPPRMLATAGLRTLALSGAFLVSIPLAFLTHWAYLCWVIFPFAVPVVQRIIRRRVPRPSGKPG